MAVALTWLKEFRKADLILIVFLLIIAVMLFFAFRSDRPVETANLFHHNQLITTLDLGVDTVFAVENRIVIEVKDKKIRIAKSDCHLQYCVKQGWSRSQPIICVPNEILIDFGYKEEEKLLITE